MSECRPTYVNSLIQYIIEAFKTRKLHLDEQVFNKIIKYVSYIIISILEYLQKVYDVTSMNVLCTCKLCIMFIKEQISILNQL